ncbi:MAG: hypothetical protein A2981_00490 [Candidatus Nealsonbacteria bacterium RIFCSPLOWO2_01_FULL_38_120]|nr:MAG: hypothetical protein A2981_00490 [Candidatus Nealsonbacteria bacterium RIFCSPLOWO2_01_FULL_38_120]
MGKNNRGKFRDGFGGGKRRGRFSLPQEIKQTIWGIFMIVVGLIIALSFFNKAGRAGLVFMSASRFLIGVAVFIIPLILILGGLSFLRHNSDFSIFNRESKIFWQVMVAIAVFILGSTGFLSIFSPELKYGGWLGVVASWPFLRYFGFWASLLVFLAMVIAGVAIFWYFLRPGKSHRAEEYADKEADSPKFSDEGKRTENPKKDSIIRKIFAPRFKVTEISPELPKETKPIEKQLANARVAIVKPAGEGNIFSYQPPPVDFLEPDQGVPNSGDTKVNSAVIKKTLQNFGIDVVMSEVNVGPTVTQYTFKPAEGIKLSKITSLSNDLALSLASHPIRIEAPIPGRSLVGIEMPNKLRAKVGLRNMIENPNFQKSTSNLILALGKDVSGTPFYADLTRMPHMLVAGSTGTGKTIFLNNLILSLLYQPSTTSKSASPESLRLILVDPKRVEFPVYENLPHLLCPVIYGAHQTVNALRWLTKEMERRFDVLASAKARDIGTYNGNALKAGDSPLPYIVVIIDELADLMAAKGREIEATIVRLAQMARAVGIHLVVATQRPSVEVITGLIKANITTRITFQVASQIDSRTILDCSGAERLIGAGDMLYLSADVGKPKRIQGAYVSEKEVRKVVKYVVEKGEELGTIMDDDLIEELNRGLEDSESEGMSAGGGDFYEQGNDPLFEEAKRTVVEMKKASASLLQRRLRIGYARAARLLDVLEEKGIVGHSDGAKPREVFGGTTLASEEYDFGTRVGAPDLHPSQGGFASQQGGIPTVKEDGAGNGDKGDWEKV